MKLIYFSILTPLFLASSFFMTSASMGKSTGNSKKVDWKAQMRVMLAESKESGQARGLFSHSRGYEDRGQIMVFSHKDGAYGRVHIVEPNANKISRVFDIEGKEWENFKKMVVIGDKLEDYKEPSFGGVLFEYLHLQKEKSGKIITTKLLYMLNPGAAKPAPDHERLIELFQSLIRANH